MVKGVCLVQKNILFEQSLLFVLRTETTEDDSQGAHPPAGHETNPRRNFPWRNFHRGQQSIIVNWMFLLLTIYQCYSPS